MQVLKCATNFNNNILINKKKRDSTRGELSNLSILFYIVSKIVLALSLL